MFYYTLNHNAYILTFLRLQRCCILNFFSLSPENVPPNVLQLYLLVICLSRLPTFPPRFLASFPCCYFPVGYFKLWLFLAPNNLGPISLTLLLPVNIFIIFYDYVAANSIVIAVGLWQIYEHIIITCQFPSHLTVPISLTDFNIFHIWQFLKSGCNNINSEITVIYLFSKKECFLINNLTTDAVLKPNISYHMCSQAKYMLNFLDSF